VLQAVLAWRTLGLSRKSRPTLRSTRKTSKHRRRGRPNGRRRGESGITSAKKIEVAVESPKVVLQDENNAVVSFKQRYRSDTLKVDSRKTLIMTRTGGRWAIQQERTGS